MTNEVNSAIDMTPHCSAGIDHRRRIIELEESDRNQWEAIEKLRNRLPVWATVIISLLTFLLGCSLTYATIAKGG